MDVEAQRTPSFFSAAICSGSDNVFDQSFASMNHNDIYGFGNEFVGMNMESTLFPDIPPNEQASFLQQHAPQQQDPNPHHGQHKLYYNQGQTYHSTIPSSIDGTHSDQAINHPAVSLQKRTPNSLQCQTNIPHNFQSTMAHGSDSAVEPSLHSAQSTQSFFYPDSAASEFSDGGLNLGTFDFLGSDTQSVGGLDTYDSAEQSPAPSVPSLTTGPSTHSSASPRGTNETNEKDYQPSPPPPPAPKRRRRRRRAPPSAEEEAQRRVRLLERNRIAASRCRKKRKQFTGDLEEQARDLRAQHDHLQELRNSLREETLFLKAQMLRQADCGCSELRQYLDNKARALTSPGGSHSTNANCDFNLRRNSSYSDGKSELSHS